MDSNNKKTWATEIQCQIGNLKAKNAASFHSSNRHKIQKYPENLGTMTLSPKFSSPTSKSIFLSMQKQDLKAHWCSLRNRKTDTR